MATSSLRELLGTRTLLASAQFDDKVLSLANGEWTTAGLPSPRGIAVGNYVSVACGDGVRTFRNDGTPGNLAYFDGDAVNAHGAVYDKANELIITAPARSSLLKVSLAGVEEIWRVPGVSQSTDNRSHINGVATKDGVVNYVTALAISDAPNGWRDEAKNRKGVLINTITNQVVLDNLFMPHTPYWKDGKVWFLNSGDGQLCTWTPGETSSTVIATLTGFSRGLCFLDDTHVAIGISQGRITAFPNLTIDTLAQPGIAIIDISSGEQVDFEPLDVQEIFDVVIGTVPLVV